MCPKGLKDVAFIAIEEKPSDNDPARKKVVKPERTVPKKGSSENQKLA
jgi:hypothetical protein